MPRTTKRSEVPEQFRDTGPTATEPQLSYLRGLREGKDLSSLTVDQIVWLNEADFDTYPSELPKKRASDIISQLVLLPRKARNEQENAERAFKKDNDLPVSENDLPDGYYALRGVEGHKNEITFYRLRSPKQGNWVGYQFLDQVVGHGKRYPVRDKATREKLYDLIREQGVDDSRQLYGTEIGCCYVCNRELTDDTSRRLGIGPVCRGDQ